MRIISQEYFQLESFVSFVNNEKREYQKLALDEFLKKYTKVDSMEENLYFLNKLPHELVNIVFNRQIETDFPYYANNNQEADFPDFDFE